MTRTLRCSSLPLAFACARSQDETSLLIEAHNGAAILGTGTHDAMTQVVAGANVDIELVARRHGVDAGELGPLVWYGRKAWEQMRDAFPLPETEVEVSCMTSGIRLVGHIDLLSVMPDEYRFLDWKSGRKEESDYYQQIAGYAACLLRGRQGPARAVGTVVWLRSQTIETYIFTRLDARRFEGKLHSRLASDNARYVHGAHCAYCPRSHDCEALNAASRRDIQIFGGYDVEGGISAASPELVVDLRRRLKLLESFAGSMEEAIRRRIATDGPLDSGDGYQLALVEENGKRVIDAEKAWPVLQAYLSDAELAQAVTVSASKVDGAVAKKAGKGKGKEAKGRLAAELQEAGAVSQGTVTKLKEIRLPKEIK